MTDPLPTHELANVLRALLSHPGRVELVPAMWNTNYEPTAWRLNVTGEGPILDKRHRAVVEAVLSAQAQVRCQTGIATVVPDVAGIF